MWVAAAAEAAEGEARLCRSNTDCVYFLASPFTCTKGSNCEYRHCEGARFNPKNCWYWFHGNCVNPSCTFRHPPLEGYRTNSVADPLSSHGSTSVKIGNPCYFYYSSRCTKGDRCPFLHEPLASRDIVRIFSEDTTVNPVDNENFAGDVMIEASKDTLAYHGKETSDLIKKYPCKEVFENREIHLFGKIRPCHESSNPELDGAITGVSETSFDNDEDMKSPALVSDQSPGDVSMEHRKQDEHRDSSPGFDVLVDGGPSNENALKYKLEQERDPEMLHVNYYHFGDPLGYDMDYHDSEYLYEQGFCGFDDRYDCSYLDYSEDVQEHDSETTSEQISHHKRKLVQPTSYKYGKGLLDLPESFTRRVSGSGFVHQHNWIRHISQRRPEGKKGVRGKKGRHKRRRGMEPRNAKITSVLEEIKSRLTCYRQDALMGRCPQPLVHATFLGQKKEGRGKGHHVPSYGAHKYPTAKVKPPNGTADFTGPKTLAQIKEEKGRTKSIFSSPSVHVSHGGSSNDFEGPKSLNELLEAKRRALVCEGSHTWQDMCKTAAW